MRSFGLVIAYDGTNYAGWQVQPNQRTIQGEIEKAIAAIELDRPVDAQKTTNQNQRVLGSGRTDAGVHAVGQIARCRLSWNADANSLLRAINSRLPDDILIYDAWESDARFHPIADAISKSYQYEIQLGGHRDIFDRHRCHRVMNITPSGMTSMNEAAATIIGTHDFASMQAAGATRDDTVRTIISSQWRQSPHQSRLPGQHVGERWIYEVTGTGFLYNMVRNLVGTMLEIGRGKQTSDWMADVLAARDR
ncbi:MAG: tRNA pseudouridine(38-40) synthase TruA, partial [Planctomycetota bacterium]